MNRLILAALAIASLSSPLMAQELTPLQQEGLEQYEVCAYCHREGGSGTLVLQERWEGDLAILENRTDLTAGYIEAVLRYGLNSMPMFNRVEMTDEQLAALSAYLTRNSE